MHSMRVPPAMTASRDTSQAALHFAHRLLCRPIPDQPDLPGLLGELAEVFRAAGAGLAGLPDGRPVVQVPAGRPANPGGWPWQEDPALLSRTRLAPGAVAVERGDGCLLVTTCTTATDS